MDKFIKVYESDLNSDLTYGEILLLAYIRSLNTTEDGCYASNDYFAKVFGCKKENIEKLLRSLKRKEYIETWMEGKKRYIHITKSNVYDITKSKHILD